MALSGLAGKENEDTACAVEEQIYEEKHIWTQRQL
jgi:hypothetical protein